MSSKLSSFFLCHQLEVSSSRFYSCLLPSPPFPSYMIDCLQEIIANFTVILILLAGIEIPVSGTLNVASTESLTYVSSLQMDSSDPTDPPWDDLCPDRIHVWFEDVWIGHDQGRFSVWCRSHLGRRHERTQRDGASPCGAPGQVHGLDRQEAQPGRTLLARSDACNFTV